MTPAVIQAWPGVVHPPQTTPFTSSGTYVIPSWANYLDIVIVGAGGGGGGTDGSGTVGSGGNAGSWSSETLIKAVSWPTSNLTITLNNGGGGGGYQSGSGGGTGGTSSVSATGMTTLSVPGGSGGGYTTGGPQAGQGAGTYFQYGIGRVGGAATGNSHANGNAPGGGAGGGGGFDGSTGGGGTGAKGEVWIVARQTATAYDLYFDSAGVGTQNNTSPWTHSIAGNCLIGVLSGYGSTHLASQTFTMKCGTTSMSLLKSVEYKTAASPFAYALMFGLMSPPTGSQSITWTSTAGQSGMGGNTVSFKNITSIGTAASVTGTGGSLAQTVTSAAGGLIVQALTDSVTAADILNYSPNPLWFGSGAGNASALTIGDAPWASSVAFSGVGVGGTGSVWAGLSVPLLV